MSRKQFAAAVVKQLEAHDLSCVLVGGACVSIYTNEKHQSMDLDFISPDSVENIEMALSEIGFRRENRYFKHSDSDFYVEFPSGPPAIGHEVPIKVEGKFKIRDTIVRLYSPTQSVMDRLAAWLHWNDRRSLIHAIWICERHPVNLRKIKDWASSESEPEKFEQFIEQLKHSGYRNVQRAKRDKARARK